MKLIPLLEDIIAKDKFQITIDYGINRTKHGKERQSRHVDSGGDEITEKEIERTVNKAIKTITIQMIQDIIDLKDPILIKNKSNDLNVVGAVTPGAGGPLSLNFKIITVMKKKDFKPKPGTKVIEV